jgi:2-polyprenyl-3-methyl-5-hydroxy-6-metoxy-1,4-benzoquinol methylase
LSAPNSVPPAAEFRPELYDAIAPGYYDEVYRRGRGVQWFWHHHRFAAVARCLPPRIRRLVDLGCGPGTFLGNLEQPYEEALGIDIAAPQIHYAISRYARPGLEFRVADVTSLAAAEPFDAAVSIEVIEHLRPEDTSAFFAAIYGLLKPGGRLVLTTPNYRSFWPLLERLVSWISPVDYREQHINPFDARRLVAAAEAAGFVAARAQTFFVVAPFVAALSTRAAATTLRWERQLLRSLGAELVLVADKPR